MPRSAANTLLRAGLLTGIIDGTFSSVLVVFFYGSTFAKLWLGVASVPLGASALEGGTPMVLVGLLMHFAVAFTWSAIFLFVVMRVRAVRRAVQRPAGVAAVAAAYGPTIWLFMSLVLIPAFTHKPPAITDRWWIQFFGHIPFVALPIVAVCARAPMNYGDVVPLRAA